MFLTLAQIEKSLRSLETVHPFFGITFLVVKKARLPIGEPIDFQLDAANKEFLDRYFKPDKDSDWYYRVFRISDKNKSWVASDYASSGLQSVNTRTFGDAFLHEKNTDIWGWKSDYVNVLKSHRKNPISAFDLAVWLYRQQDWGETPSAEHVTRTFLEEFAITPEEQSQIFDTSVGSELPLHDVFQSNRVTWDELRAVTGAPPDASQEERVITRLDILVENVRCLVGLHEIPIRPLTILVGENSSGKTTLLAALAAVCNPTFPIWPGFNDRPHKLGNYESIATSGDGNSNSSKDFSIGYRVKGKSKEESSDIVARYTNDRGQAELSSFEVKSSVGELELSLKPDRTDRYRVTLLGVGKSRRALEASVRKTEESKRTDFVTFIASNLTDLGSPSRSRGRTEFEFKRQLVKISSFISPKRALSLAPTRPEPKRTYDQVPDDFSPESYDIPHVLARVLSEDLGSKQRNILIRALEQFGRDSGLFDEIRVKPLGENASAPFQILVNPSGQLSNFLDVGYGVSQALPIVVQSVLLDAPQLMLVQQPEAHLHPKAQAALGSFFAKLVMDGQRQFVIETHSDFIIDRIRQEVANGRLRPSVVEILFFHKAGRATTIHQLELDDLGNIIGAPPNYREFFLREDLNLMSSSNGDE